jgi:acyl-CoA synthetase (AMP-forming)/AMP-acid ligase II
MSSWNLADCLDAITEICGSEDALIQGTRRFSWSQLERRARNLAAWMLERGVSHQGKLAIYTYNHPAYMESIYAGFKASMVPVNVNYRYREEELLYLLDNADAEVVVVHEDFAPVLSRIQDRLPQLRATLVVFDRDEGDLPDLTGAESFEQAAENDRPAPRVPRSGDDMMFLYTGGTTGMPKGAMWRQDDLYQRFAGGLLGAPPTDMEAFVTSRRNLPIRLRTLVGPPLMHGTGLFTALIGWLTGGAVIVLDNPKKFDAAELWRVVERDKPTAVSIVGDSFAKPLVRALEEEGRGYDISSVVMMASSGVIWSQETKQALLKANPTMILVDSFSSSEALGMGMSVTTAAGPAKTAKFELTDTTMLFDENLRPVETKPGATGMVGSGRNQPVGYYKDPEKTARTFVRVGEERFSVPGDWARVNEDGVSLTLLGRGSVCINSGGEKIFPEEVEEVVKRHPAVEDVVVVGVPDEKFGEALTAVLSLSDPDTDPEAIKIFVKENLASFKAPRHIVVVDEVYRTPSGKVDFKHARKIALAALGLDA